jgi:hypothetical protein
MGKVDDMRRQREALHGVTEPAEESTEAEPGDGADTEGKCSVCRKLKAVQGGVVVSHQKGLGKMCPGSRKPPA